MDAFDRIADQPGAVRALRSMVHAERIATAYLFDGPDGVGKLQAAVAFATSVVAGTDAHLARRIQDGTHPDVRVFHPRDEGMRNIKVESLKEEILSLTQFAPFEARACFFIFPDADLSLPAYPPESANALLKTLEEPRPSVHFVLTASRPDQLLPTIRSRCQRVRFGELTEATITRLVRERGASEDRARTIATLAQGQASIALMLNESDAYDNVVETVREVDRAVASRSIVGLLRAAERLSKHDNRDLALAAIQSWYGDVARIGIADNYAPKFAASAGELAQRAESMMPNTAASCVAATNRAQRAIRANANPQLTLEAMLLAFAFSDDPDAYPGSVRNFD